MVDVLQRRDWPAARRTAKRYASLALGDVGRFLLLFTQWSTYRYVLLCIFWGVLAPLDLFYKTYNVGVGLLLWAGFSAIPFALAFSFGPRSLADGAADACGLPRPVFTCILDAYAHPLHWAASGRTWSFSVTWPLFLPCYCWFWLCTVVKVRG